MFVLDVADRSQCKEDQSNIHQDEMKDVGRQDGVGHVFSDFGEGHKGVHDGQEDGESMPERKRSVHKELVGPRLRWIVLLQVIYIKPTL